jgi:hypothetical protein
MMVSYISFAMNFVDNKNMLLREQPEHLENTIAQFKAEINYLFSAHRSWFSSCSLLTSLCFSDMEQLRRKEGSQLMESRNLNSQTQVVQRLTMQLQTNVMKAQAKAMDLELRRLDAFQAADHLTCIKVQYLPLSIRGRRRDVAVLFDLLILFDPSFSAAVSARCLLQVWDYSVLCPLLFKRLAFKSDLIIKHLDQTHNISEKLSSLISTNLLAVWKVCSSLSTNLSKKRAKTLILFQLRQRLGWLANLSRRFEVFITRCSVETSWRWAKLTTNSSEQRQVSTAERSDPSLLRVDVSTENWPRILKTRVDAIMETPQKGGAERDREHSWRSEVRARWTWLVSKFHSRQPFNCLHLRFGRMIAQLEHLGDIYLANLKPGDYKQSYALTRAIDFNADRMAVDLTYVKQTISQASQDRWVSPSHPPFFSFPYWRGIESR